VAAIGAALEPAHDDGALGYVDVVPAQIACLAHPQAVSVDQQADEPIALAVAIAFQCSEQPVYFILGQMLANAIRGISLAAFRWTGRITLRFSLAEMDDLRRHRLPFDLVLVAEYNRM
jgi:hypothetical protein